MGLRALSSISSPQQGIPALTGGQPRFGGGKGMAGSTSQQANPQSQFLQQLLPMLLARRMSQMGQAPAFMTPAQRLAQIPQQAMPRLTQATPPPLFGNQPSPGMQAQQAYQANAAQQAAQQINAIASSQQLGNKILQPDPAHPGYFTNGQVIFVGNQD